MFSHGSPLVKVPLLNVLRNYSVFADYLLQPCSHAAPLTRSIIGFTCNVIRCVSELQTK